MYVFASYLGMSRSLEIILVPCGHTSSVSL